VAFLIRVERNIYKSNLYLFHQDSSFFLDFILFQNLKMCLPKTSMIFKAIFIVCASLQLLGALIIL